MSPAPQPRPFFVEQTSTLSDPSAAPERVLHAAGDMLRRSEAAQRHGAPIDRALIDTALKRLGRTDIVKAFSLEVLSECEARVRRGADEAFEVALPETDGESELWRAAAFEALQMRDALASRSAALMVWSSLREAADVVEQTTLALAKLDAKLKKLTPYYTSINRERRIALEGLDGGYRDAAWWFGDRLDQDELLGKLGALDSGDDSPAAPVAPKLQQVLAMSELPALAEADGLLLREELGTLTTAERAHLNRLVSDRPAWKAAADAAAAVDVEHLPEDDSP